MAQLHAFPHNFHELVAVVATDAREEKMLEILAATYVRRIREQYAAGAGYAWWYMTEFETEEYKIINALRRLDFQVVDYAVPATYNVCRHGEQCEIVDTYEKPIICVVVQWNY